MAFAPEEAFDAIFFKNGTAFGSANGMIGTASGSLFNSSAAASSSAFDFTFLTFLVVEPEDAGVGIPNGLNPAGPPPKRPAPASLAIRSLRADLLDSSVSSSSSSSSSSSAGSFSPSICGAPPTDEAPSAVSDWEATDSVGCGAASGIGGSTASTGACASSAG